MKAVLLAAGRGRRLGLDGPKCLLEVRGQTLLERHLVNMEQVGIERVTVVKGHAHETMDAALADIAQRRERAAQPLRVVVDTVFNDQFVHGAIVSLHCAIDTLVDGGIWMDADVIYPARLLARLVESAHDSCVLLDGRSSEQGEEMMLAVKDGFVRTIARSVGSDWDLVGESVGFFKADRATAAALKRTLAEEVAAGRLDQEHEAALAKILPDGAFGFERVDDLPWTEIDFPEDIQRANALAEVIDAE